MTTACQITLYETSASKANCIAQKIFDQTKAIEKKYNFHNEQSWLNTLINQRKKQSIKLDSQTAKILEKVHRLSGQVNGVFDITLGTYVYAAKQFQSLSKQQLKEKYQKVIGLENWNIQNNFIHFKHKDTKIDLGGVMKEVAVDMASELALNASGASLINFGGDMKINGRKPNGECFKVGIKNPLNTKQILLSLEVENLALTTSGHYARIQKLAGNEHSHILSSTLSNEKHEVLSSTLLAEDTLTAGLYSTSLLLDKHVQCPDNVKYLLIDNQKVMHRFGL